MTLIYDYIYHYWKKRSIWYMMIIRIKCILVTYDSLIYSPHTSGPKCTCSRNRLFVQNKKNDIFGMCEIVKSIIIKITGDFNSTRNILKNPSCHMCRNELRCQTPPLSKRSGSSCRCGVDDWTRPKNAGLPKAFSRLPSPFRLSGWSSTKQATEKSERLFLAGSWDLNCFSCIFRC